MTSTTSGLTEFTMDVDEIIEEALEPLEGDFTDGVEAMKARRSLNLILIELQNKNIPLNKLEEVVVPFTTGVSNYVLDEEIVDVLELSMKGDQADDPATKLARTGRKEFHLIPNKTQTGRPTTYTTDRNANAVTVKLWPTPDKTFEGKALVSKRVEDITASFQKINLSYRYMPLLIKWLSYEIALKRMDFPLDRITTLRNRLNEIMIDTFEEDRERADFMIIPGGISGTN